MFLARHFDNSFRIALINAIDHSPCLCILFSCLFYNYSDIAKLLRVNFYDTPDREQWQKFL